MEWECRQAVFHPRRARLLFLAVAESAGGGCVPVGVIFCYRFSMISILDILAEQRIVEAQRLGELDNLPGAGKPLELDDDPLVSPEQRMVNKILKNAGCEPAPVTLRKAIAELKREIDALPPGERQTELKRERALLLIKLHLES
jgi:hypothetical protein